MSGPVRVMVLAAVALLGAAGCGDDDGEDAAQDPAPANGRHIERANAVCRDGLREARRLGRTIQGRVKPDSETDLVTEAFVKPGIPLLERQAERLRRLDRGQDPQFTAYVELYDPVIELTRQRLRAGLRGDLELANQLTAYTEQLGAEAQLAAQRAGLDDCTLDYQAAIVAASAAR